MLPQASGFEQAQGVGVSGSAVLAGAAEFHTWVQAAAANQTPVSGSRRRA
jgi:hypothetical protein